jgi:flagellar motor switch protein FliN/FliY
MTEELTATVPPEATEFLKLWSDSFSQVLGQITGTAVAGTVVAQAPAVLPPAGDSDLLVLIASSGSLRGEMTLRMTPAVVLSLAQTFMSEPATPEAQPTPEHREAVVELLRQIGGVVSTAAKARWGEVQLAVEAAAAPPSWPPASTFWLQAGEAGPAQLTLEFGLSAALVAELRAEKENPAKSAPSATSAVSGVAPASAANFIPGAGALDVLMDVHLAMTLRFGGRTLLLREVLEFSPGAVVELDRKIKDPVDLLLDGKLVARGELVVIDGNYGLRVTDVSAIASSRAEA